MLSSRSLKLSLILLFLFAGLSFLSAMADEQTASTEEGDTLVAAPDTANLLRRTMDDFHAVLQPLWHESYPEEDLKTIREKAPLLQEKIMALIRVPAPAEFSQHRTGQSLHRPLIHPHCTNGPVEADGWRIPIQHRPFQSGESTSYTSLG